MSITIIKARKGWQPIDWRELHSYKDLFLFLVLRNIKVLYKQTVLGFSWAIIRPFFSMVVFSVVFGALAQIPSDGIPYPIFVYTALLPWTYFATATSGATNSLISNANMLRKVYFPRLVIPMTPVLAGLVDLAVASLMLAGLMIWYGVCPTGSMVFLPYLVLLMILTAAGIGMWLSALAIQYRDIRQAITFLVQLLMYAAPVVWPVSLITQKAAEMDLEQWGGLFRLFYGIYPMAGVIEGFRAALIGRMPMPWDLIAMGTLSALIIAISGVFYFRRMERYFADVA